MSAWTDHVAKWQDCTKCPLGHQRSNIVFARAGVVGGITKGGALPVDVAFVGEAPGASEDALGLPFVGPAGDLQQQITERALPVGTTYTFCNLVCCYPREAKDRGDNEPEPEEIMACRPRLYEFLGIARPKLVVLVGVLASDYIGHDANGNVLGAKAVDVIHPAAILRMPLAQKHMAIQQSIVTIRNGYENVVQ